jgi:predicted RNase H-like HicB family nuclease
MIGEFTAVFEPQEDGWIVAYVAEVPGANTQGRTMEEARENLIEALQLVLECQRDQALADAAPNASLERIRVELPSHA